MSDEAEGVGEDSSEAVGVTLAGDASLVLWDVASTIATPDGVILTLFHNVPLHDISGELVGITRKPIAYYSMSAKDLVGTTELFIRQSIAWAGQFGDDNTQGEVEEKIVEAIEEGRRRATEIKRDQAEPGGENGDS